MCLWNHLWQIVPPVNCDAGWIQSTCCHALPIPQCTRTCTLPRQLSLLWWSLSINQRHNHVLIACSCLCVCLPPDLNECLYRPCSHECVNTYGSFHCACPHGMMTSYDQSTCRGCDCICTELVSIVYVILAIYPLKAVTDYLFSTLDFFTGKDRLVNF